ncbi:MAG: lipoprotein [Pseudomonadota bacterium]
MTIRILMIALLAGTLGVSACGKKGDPIPPGQEEEKEKPTS